jgi:hypothetical protein
MKKPSRAAAPACLIVLASPLFLAWISPGSGGGFLGPALAALAPEYVAALGASFRQLAVTLVATAAFAASIALVLGYLSIFAPSFGRLVSSVLEAVESVPSILVALFCYAPVSGYLARHAEASSAAVSLLVFILAATATTLPEAVRCLTIPLGELYYRKYSLSFRSYGFRKSRILRVLMRTRAMRGALSRAVAGILLKTLVLDTSFGFIIQLGFGSYGTPAHLSPGALIAANRDALFPGGKPVLFWLPALAIAAISLGLVLALGERKESLE